jgi:hypothetical protein
MARSAPGSLWPKVLLLVILCTAVGGLLGFFQGTKLPELLSAKAERLNRLAAGKAQPEKAKEEPLDKATAPKNVKSAA